jgi:D-xylose transport system substrate-binding protein
VHIRRFTIGAVTLVATLGLLGTACSSSKKTTTPPTSTPSASSTTAAAATVPSDLSTTSFDVHFTYMSKLTGLTSAGHGLVGVILPDTTSSTRYVNFDAPYLTKALLGAGYNASQFKINNAQGSDTQELSLAQADISAGATVLIFDPLDSTVGSQVANLAAQHGVKLISYDRATFTGTNTYYVSFNNEEVGKLIGNGFLSCVTSWGVSKPQVFELSGGEDTDPNAISFANGYNLAIWNKASTPLPAGTTNSQGMTLVGEQITPGWTNSTGQTIFQQQYTAHPNINATVEANDGLANAVITVLKNKGVAPKKVPTTGQDATLQGMEWILQGYQCGSVYKPIYLEAQDAVALATILRAGQTPPPALVNSTTNPPPKVTGNSQPASLLTPTWVTATNMNDTVIKDGFISASALCAAVGTSVCTANGITP